MTAPIRDRESEIAGAETFMRVPILLPHELLDYISAASTQLYAFFHIYVQGLIFTYTLLGPNSIMDIVPYVQGLIIIHLGPECRPQWDM